VPRGDVATLHMGAEGVCDNIAALQRRGDTSHVHVSARICYKWNVNQWYMGTVQKRCDMFVFYTPCVCQGSCMRTARTQARLAVEIEDGFL
jgi:hypothetical protein